MAKFYDAHTHGFGESGVVSVHSVRFLGGVCVVPGSGLYSVGVHPWDAGSVAGVGDWAAQLRRVAMDSRCVAIGECGLDSLRGVALAAQREVFAVQCSMAVELGKALVVHCVRAEGEVLQMLAGIGVPRLFHGYKRGVSGAFVSANSPAAIDRLSGVGLDSLLLETDDKPQKISELYDYLAQQRKLPLGEVKKQLETNFKELYYGE